MACDCKERKTLLYADLFKQNHKTTMSEGSICSSWNDSLPSDSSSSSGFSTPFGSELESSEGNDGDFTAELTRQMAECMLQEEDEEEKQGNSVTELTPQVYQLENQPRVRKEVTVSRGRRVKGTELAQQSQLDKTEQHHVGYTGRDWRIGKGQAGSDMRVVFLGGSGSKKGSSGTGVFLPRVNNDPVELKQKEKVELKKKPGCSTVLIPTRVLQVLELHFNRHPDSAGPPLRGGSNVPYRPRAADEWSRSKEESNRHSDEEMQLPQEWTY